MRNFAVTPFAVNASGANITLTGPSPAPFGLMDATSKEGGDAAAGCGDCAWRCGDYARTRITTPAVASAPIRASDLLNKEVAIISLPSLRLRGPVSPVL